MKRLLHMLLIDFFLMSVGEKKKSTHGVIASLVPHSDSESFCQTQGRQLQMPSGS